jgi:Cdc6-like AAA superfamily ATPase
MSRSLKVNPQSIQRVKQALQHNGFPSQKVLAEELGISPPTINKFFNSKPIDFTNFAEICQKLGLDWREVSITSDPTPEPTAQTNPIVDLSQAPSNAHFYGRERDRETLTQWIDSDKCRVVAVLGMGGTGKTSLVRKIVDEFVREGQEFNAVIWRNLEHLQSLEELLEDLFRKFGLEWVASREIFDKVNRLIVTSQ